MKFFGRKSSVGEVETDGLYLNESRANKTIQPVQYTVGNASLIAVSIDELTRTDVNALEYAFDTLKRLLA